MPAEPGIFQVDRLIPRVGLIAAEHRPDVIRHNLSGQCGIRVSLALRHSEELENPESVKVYSLLILARRLSQVLQKSIKSKKINKNGTALLLAAGKSDWNGIKPDNIYMKTRNNPSQTENNYKIIHCCVAGVNVSSQPRYRRILYIYFSISSPTNLFQNPPAASDLFCRAIKVNLLRTGNRSHWTLVAVQELRVWTS